MEEVYLDKDKRVIFGSVGEVNCTSPDHTDQIIMKEVQLTH